jgi:hypothetical protein
MTLCLFTNVTSSEWAAWVQAIGSLAAVMSGTAAVFWQNHQAKKVQRTRDVERIRAVAMLLRLSAEAMEKWLKLWKCEEVPEPKVIQQHWRTFELAAEELRRIGGDVALSPVIVMNLILARECVRHISEAVGGLHLGARSNDIGSSVQVNISDLYHYEECMHAEARRLEKGLPATNTDDA